MVRAMVPTPPTTQQSGIPPASSILATLGCKVLQSQLMRPRPMIAEDPDSFIGCVTNHDCVNQSDGSNSGERRVRVDLSAERSEDGARGRYTALLGGGGCQNHCSDHSGFLTGADT